MMQKVMRKRFQKDQKIFLEFDEKLNEKNVFVYDTALKAAKGVDAIIIMTEWEEFKNISWTSLIKEMKRPAWIFDTRSVVDVLKAEQAGFNVWQIGNTQKLE